MDMVVLLVSISAGACAIGGSVVSLYGLLSGNETFFGLGVPALVIGLVFSLVINVAVRSESSVSRIKPKKE